MRSESCSESIDRAEEIVTNAINEMREHADARVRFLETIDPATLEKAAQLKALAETAAPGSPFRLAYEAAVKVVLDGTKDGVSRASAIKLVGLDSPILNALLSIQWAIQKRKAQIAGASGDPELRGMYKNKWREEGYALNSTIFKLGKQLGEIRAVFFKKDAYWGDRVVSLMPYLSNHCSKSLIQASTESENRNYLSFIDDADLIRAILDNPKGPLVVNCSEATFFSLISYDRNSNVLSVDYKTSCQRHGDFLQHRSCYATYAKQGRELIDFLRENLVR